MDMPRRAASRTGRPTRGPVIERGERREEEYEVEVDLNSRIQFQSVSVGGMNRVTVDEDEGYTPFALLMLDSKSASVNRISSKLTGSVRYISRIA